MKTIKAMKSGIALFCAVTLIVFLSGCGQDQIMSASDSLPTSGDMPVGANARGKGGNSGGTKVNYPLSGSVDLVFKNNGTYAGGSINLDNGMSLTIPRNAVTPPPGMFGQKVTITMTCKKPNTGRNELEVEFGPHGSLFAPQAVVVFDYSDLGIEFANLYYIDGNNNYVLQTPDQIDVINKKVYLYLDHFSRYAIGAD